MSFMQSQKLGFDKDKVLLVDQEKLPGNITRSNTRFFKNNLMSQPGIVSVSANGGVPGRNGWTAQMAWPEGKPKNAQLIVEYIPVDETYLGTLGLQLMTGRDFRPGSVVDSGSSLIVNEAAVKEFGWKNAEDALGKKLTTSGKDGQVIGVLKDYHQHGLQEKINPVVLGVSDYPSLVAIRYNNISPEKLTTEVKVAWSAAYSGYDLDYHFMDEDFQLQYQDEAKFEHLFGIAAFFSIVIACMGLFGLAIFTAQKRIKEIGVRKVLGASVSSIAVLLSKDFMKLVTIAIASSIPLSWWAMDIWLQKFAYRITISYGIFLTAGATAILLSMITISYQAIKAALTDPVKSLRSE
jgi:putative ABC transport system permease protein